MFFNESICSTHEHSKIFEGKTKIQDKFNDCMQTFSECTFSIHYIALNDRESCVLPVVKIPLQLIKFRSSHTGIS